MSADTFRLAPKAPLMARLWKLAPSQSETRTCLHLALPCTQDEPCTSMLYSAPKTEWLGNGGTRLPPVAELVQRLQLFQLCLYKTPIAEGSLSL